MFEETKRYYKIGEVADLLGVNASLIRYWEKEFPEDIKPKKKPNGVRVFRKEDIDRLRTIYGLVKEKQMTLEGARLELKRLDERRKRNERLIRELKQLRAQLVDLRDQL